MFVCRIYHDRLYYIPCLACPNKKTRSLTSMNSWDNCFAQKNVNSLTKDTESIKSSIIKQLSVLKYRNKTF